MRAEQLRVSYVWADDVMADIVANEPTPITLGATGGATFAIPRVDVPPGFVLMSPTSAGYALNLLAGMGGRVCIGGQEREVEELVQGGRAGLCAMRIGPGDWGVIELDERGQHSVFFQFVPATRPLPKPAWRDRETLLPPLAFAVILHAIVVLFAINANADDRVSFVPMPAAEPTPVVDPILRPTVHEPEGGEPSESVDPSTAPKPAAAADEPDKGKPTRVRRGKPNAATNASKSDNSMLPPALRQSLSNARKDMRGFGAKIDRAVHKGIRGSETGNLAGAPVGTRDGDGDGGTPDGTGKSPVPVGDMNTDAGDDGKKLGGRKVKPGKLRGEWKVPDQKKRVVGGDRSKNRSDTEILAVVKRHANAYRACYERMLQRLPNLRGKVVLTWKIRPDGTVTGDRVASSTLGNGFVHDCLRRVARRMKFKPADGTSIVRFPFLFSSR